MDRLFVDSVTSNQVTQHEVKDDTHGVFTPEMLKLPQATWIEAFLKGIADPSTFLEGITDSNNNIILENKIIFPKVFKLNPNQGF